MVTGAKRRTAWSLALLVALVTSSARAQPRLPELSLDLHAHLFMKEGLGWLFHGRFEEPHLADSWDDRLSSKVDAAALEQSGIGLVVVALFAHPLYVADMRASIRAQIAAAKRFVRRHPNWAIAKSPAEARRLLGAGRRVLVLSLEGASGVLETEEDLREFVDREGIRIVTELHLVDDAFGGVAMLDGFQYLANPLGVVDQLLDHRHDEQGIEVNRRGLSPLGRRLAVELIARGVWIDLTHASDASLTDLVPMLERAGQPLLLTHAQLRTRHAAERATSETMLRRVAASGGVVGLLPSEDAFPNAAPAARFCPAGCSPEACRGSVHTFAEVVDEAAAILGPEAIALGSDQNGGMRHLAQACGTGTALDGDAGFHHVGQTALLYRALRQLGAPIAPHRDVLDHFLSAWDRVTPTAIVDEDHLPPLPSRDDVRGPSIGAGIGAAVVTGDTDGAAFMPQAAFWIRKDMGRDREVEPMIYLLRAEAELAKSFSDDRISYADARMAALGVVTRDADDLLRGEALVARLRHHDAVDQSLRLRLSALHGQAQTMVGLWKAPGEHDLFLAVRTDLLGYERIEHGSAAPYLHGLLLGGGGLGLGGSVSPADGWLVTLRSDVEADLTFLFGALGGGVAYQTDVVVSGGFSLGTRDRTFTQFLEGRWYATQERWQRAVFRQTPHLRAGIRLGF